MYQLICSSAILQRICNDAQDLKDLEALFTFVKKAALPDGLATSAVLDKLIFGLTLKHDLHVYIQEVRNAMTAAEEHNAKAEAKEKFLLPSSYLVNRVLGGLRYDTSLFQQESGKAHADVESVLTSLMGVAKSRLAMEVADGHHKKAQKAQELVDEEVQFARTQTNFNHSFRGGRNGGPPGGNRGRANQQAGRGGARPFLGTCYNCARPGHRAIDCPGKQLAVAPVGVAMVAATVGAAEVHSILPSVCSLSAVADSGASVTVCCPDFLRRRMESLGDGAQL